MCSQDVGTDLQTYIHTHANTDRHTRVENGWPCRLVAQEAAAVAAQSFQKEFQKLLQFCTVKKERERKRASSVTRKQQTCVRKALTRIYYTFYTLYACMYVGIYDGV